MYRISVAVSMMIAMYLDSFLFARLHIFGIRPDCLLALLVSLGVLLGQGEGLVLGLGAGLLTDVLFGRAIGLGAIAYMLAGVAGGFFYKKYYADNIVIPAATAAVCALGKEHVMALSVRMLGGAFSYFEMLFTYILPCTLATGLFCALTHLLMKPTLQRQIRKHYERHAGGGIR